MLKSCSVEEEIYTHEYLWRSASRLLRIAETEEEASYHLLLPSLLMSFMAFEAFVIFCGFVLLPELWQEEKKHFKGKGMEGKLEVIVGQLPSFSWRKGEPPYQRIKTLETFRDVVAHGKVVATQYVTEQKEDGSHFQFKHAWDSHLSVDAVKNARADIKAFCQSLVVELRKVSDHLHLNFNAFEGEPCKRQQYVERRLTTPCSRLPPAYAPASLRLPAAAEGWRSAASLYSSH